MTPCPFALDRRVIQWGFNTISGMITNGHLWLEIIRVKHFIALLSLFLLALMYRPVSGQTGIYEVISEQGFVSVRATPSRDAGIIATLPPGARIEVLETVLGTVVNGSEIWYRIDVAGVSGFVHSSIVRLVQEIDQPEQATQTAPPAAQIQPTPVPPVVETAAQINPEIIPVMTVQGIGVVSAPPDIAVLEIGVQRVGSDSGRVYTQVIETLDGIRTALRALNIADEDVQMSNISIESEDRLEGDNPTGEFLYRMEGILYVVVRDLELLSGVTGSAVTNGANIVRDLELALQNIDQLEEQARSIAIQDAYNRATQFARQTAVSVGVPIEITEVEVSVDTPNSMFEASGDEAGIYTITEPGQISLQVIVEVNFLIEYPSSN